MKLTIIIALLCTAWAAFGEVEESLYFDKADVRVLFANEISDGKRVILQLETTPYIKTSDAKGSPVYDTIASGKFDIQTALVATNAGPNQDQKIILTNFVSNFAYANSPMVTTVRAIIPKTAPNANVVLVVRMMTKRKDKPLMYEGTCDLGSLRSYHLVSCAMVSVSIGQYLTGAANYDEIKRADLASRNERLSFEILKFKPVDRLHYSLETCVTDNLSGSPIVRAPFRIQYLNENGQPVEEKAFAQTDDTGCLRWVAQFPSQKLDTFVKHIDVRLGDSNAGREMGYLISPKEFQNPFLFGWDFREVGFDLVAALSKPKN